MNRRLCRATSTVSGLGLLAVIVGCGGKYDSTVSGVVKLDGKTVPRATVTFSPQSPGPPGYALTDGEGNYTVRTGLEEGLPSGQYTVTVAAHEQVSPPAKGGPPPLGKEITPAWYRSPTTSGLSFTLEPGDNEINLELKSTPPPGWKPPRARR